MEVRTQWVPGTDSIEVWFFMRDSYSGKVSFCLIEDGELLWRIPEEGEIPKPTLRLRSMEWERLETALKRETPASATPAHLADAIAVRDRLLAMVERGWEW